MQPRLHHWEVREQDFAPDAAGQLAAGDQLCLSSSNVQVAESEVGGLALLAAASEAVAASAGLAAVQGMSPAFRIPLWMLLLCVFIQSRQMSTCFLKV